jgi:hypothetical protein
LALAKPEVSPKLRREDSLPYVKRAQIDAELGAFIDRPRQTIFIVGGPRGAGKTTAVAHALERIDGTILIQLPVPVLPEGTSIASMIFNEFVGLPGSTGRWKRISSSLASRPRPVGTGRSTRRRKAGS